MRVDGPDAAGLVAVDGRHPAAGADSRMAAALVMLAPLAVPVALLGVNDATRLRCVANSAPLAMVLLPLIEQAAIAYVANVCSVRRTATATAGASLDRRHVGEGDCGECGQPGREGGEDFHGTLLLPSRLIDLKRLRGLCERAK